MDLDQQAEQAQQKQGLPASMSMLGQGQGQGQGVLQSLPDPYSQSTRGYQSNPVTAAGVAYTSPTPSNSIPGGRGGLVTYPLPASGSASNSSIPSATFASSGGRGGGHTGGQGQGQGSRTSYNAQAQSQTAAATDYSYGQQGHYSSYNGGTMQTKLQYVGQQTNPYSASQSQSQSQGQGQGQGQYTPQQQPYY